MLGPIESTETGLQIARASLGGPVYQDLITTIFIRIIHKLQEKIGCEQMKREVKGYQINNY